jgi:hypothetical protein
MVTVVGMPAADKPTRAWMALQGDNRSASLLFNADGLISGLQVVLRLRP